MFGLLFMSPSSSWGFSKGAWFASWCIGRIRVWGRGFMIHHPTNRFCDQRSLDLDESVKLLTEANGWNVRLWRRLFGDRSMLDKIKALFSESATQADDNDAALHLAAAVLLLAVANSDHSVDEKEIWRLRSTLQRDWLLDEAELDGLVAEAQDSSGSSVSLQEHIDLINHHFSPARKLGLFRSLWQAACADGQIHHHEERLIRRLADLLHVSQEEFVRSKHWALESQERE
jgi:uncharacterized tellurite resistance protein B-like protein